MIKKARTYFTKKAVIGELTFNIRKTFVYVIIIVFSLLFYFKPFSLSLLSIKTQLILISGCSLLGGLGYIISISLLMPIKTMKLTKLRVVTIVLTNFIFAWLMIYGFLMLCFNVNLPEPFSIKEPILIPKNFFYKTLFYTLGTGSFTYLLLYMYNMIKSEVNVEVKNKSDIIPTDNFHSDGKIISLFGKNINEYLTLNSNNFIFAKSEGHYIKLYYLCNKNLQLNKYVFRNTMTNLEHMTINCSSIYRCHKSFFINLDFLISIVGNSNKSQVYIKHSPYKIPVSKQKINYLREVIKSKKSSR